MPKHTVFSSNGAALHFEEDDEDLYSLYLAQSAALSSTIYRALRKRHGIYASNQDKYISPKLRLNSFDSKVMEWRNEALEAFLSHCKDD